MENYFRKCRLLPAMTLLGGLALASCVNSDYDFNEVEGQSEKPVAILAIIV